MSFAAKGRVEWRTREERTRRNTETHFVQERHGLHVVTFHWKLSSFPNPTSTKPWPFVTIQAISQLEKQTLKDELWIELQSRISLVFSVWKFASNTVKRTYSAWELTIYTAATLQAILREQEMPWKAKSWVTALRLVFSLSVSAPACMWGIYWEAQQTTPYSRQGHFGFFHSDF